MPTTSQQPLAYSVSDLAAVAGIGRTTAYAEAKAGRLLLTKLGRRTIVMREDLEQFLADRRAEALAAREAAAGTPPP